MAGTVSRMSCAAAMAAVLSLAWVGASPALAAQRVALVIGNASYAHAPTLSNPLNDAADVGAALGRLGFSVTRLENANQARLRRGLQEFALAASASEVAVVFYAGHGIEVDQRNFLVPVDARLASDQDVEFEAVPLELVSRAVERASGLRLVILDACRENPFAVKMQRAGATRSIGRGLARVEPSGETLIAYAAKEDTVALDGSGRNSPYSEALLANLEEPGLEVGLMFRKVRDAVLALTGGRQEPFVYGSLSSRGVYLAAAPAPTPAPSAASASVVGSEDARVTTEQLAARAYEAAERVNTVVAFEAVVRRFPESIYADLARAQIGKLTEPGAQASGSGAAGAAAASAVSSGGAQPEPSAPAPAQPTPQEVETSLGLERTERRWVQQGLASLGYAPGPADGLFGTRTREAIRRYQSEKGFEETEYLTGEESQALAALGEEAAQVQAKAEAERREAQRRERERREAARRVEPGHRFRDCDGRWCPELVVVAGGTYRMGSPPGEEGRDDDEGPVHRVRIAEPFAVGLYEVTRGEWRRFVEETGHSMGDACQTYESGEWEERSGRGWRNPGFSQTERHPVVCVNWEDARAYVRWLTRKTGERYRLLSESEWEYVARAGTSTARYWGEGERGQCRHGNGADASAKRKYSTWTVASCDDGHVHTSPAGSYAKNGFGLHDVHGNVWEWVEDCWHDGYAGASGDGSAWTSGGDCSRRVVRGGSWIVAPRFMRSALRGGYSAGVRGFNVGFRVARTLD